MNKENKGAALSKMWMEAQLLRSEGKNVSGLIEIVEERLFEEADLKLDRYFEGKRKEKVLYESKEKK
jgi:hypothetical protein